MRLRLIAELQLTHKSEIDPVSQAKKRDRVQKLYFYDLPEIIQKAAFADMSYDDFAEAKIWNGAYFLKTKDGQEFGYNPDGTRWKPVLEASDYDGLEDADEFGDHYHEECYNCGDRYDLTQLRENIRYCQNCERKYCTKCAEREEFVWRTAEQLGINHTYPETLLIAYCPACSGPAEQD